MQPPRHQLLVILLASVALLSVSAQLKQAESNSFIQAGHTRDVLFVGWSADGNLLASYSASDGWIKIWNARNGKLLWDINAIRLKPDKVLKSSDGSLLVSGRPDVEYEIRDARTGDQIWSIKAHSTSDERVTSPDGKTIAVRGHYGDGSVSLVDARTNQLIRRLEGHPGIVYALAFSPDGKFIASGSGDKTIKFWDAQTGKLLKTLFGHTSKINSIAFSRDGQTLASGSEDDTLKIWNARSGELLRTIDGLAGVNGIKGQAFSPDGQTVIGGSGAKVRIWETATGKLVRTLETHETHLSGDLAGVHVNVCCGSEVFSVSFSSDGRLIVSAHDDGTIKFWDLKNSEPVRIIKGQSPGMRAAALSPNGKLIAAGYNESDSLDLWSVQDGKLVMQLGENANSVRSLAFSADGRMIVSAHPSDLKLWDAKTGALLRQLWRPYSESDQVAFSPDGKRIVAGGENQNIILWDAKTGRLLWSLIPND